MAQERAGCTYCQIGVTPTELQFTSEEGGPSPDVQWLRVELLSTPSGCSLWPRWSYAADVAWLHMSTMGTRIMIRDEVSGRPAGQYEGHIMFTTDQPQGPISVLVKSTITPKPVPLQIVTAVVPEGMQGQPYSFQFEAEGGRPPYAWNSSGYWPVGLYFDALTGKITGIPTIWGVFDLKVGVEDSTGVAYSDIFRLRIAEAPAPWVDVVITSPVAGAVWYEGDTQDIEWTSEYPYDAVVDIMVIYDGIPHSIAEGIPVAWLKYVWQVDTVANESNVIRLVLPDGRQVESGAFAIRKHPGCLPFTRLLDHIKRAM
jgi:hypothetical protein